MNGNIGEGLQHYAIEQLRNRIRENRERILRSKDETGTCLHHGCLCDGVAVMLEAIEVILAATTRRSKPMMVLASIGSGIGAAVAFFAAIYRILTQQ